MVTSQLFFRFAEFQCIVDISFWDEVIRLKLKDWKLACPVVPLAGFLQPPNILRITRDSLRARAHRDQVVGTFYHTNSWEEFCALTFNELALHTIAPLRATVAENAAAAAPTLDAASMLPFTVVAFMDLKEYVMRYAVSIGTLGTLKFQLLAAEDCPAPAEPRVSSLPLFELLPTPAAAATAPERPLVAEDASTPDAPAADPPQLLELRVYDHSPLNLHVRNAILASCPVDGSEFVVTKPTTPAMDHWQAFHFKAAPVATASASSESTTPIIAGWLRRRTPTPQTDAQHEVLQLPPQCIFQLDLQSFLSSKVVQQNATELNVRLIKWRMIPEFDPEMIQKLRVMIIGMGTLGCFICRELIGWGVCHFTLIDCGIVSPSNPARQCLYSSADVAGCSSTGRASAKVHIAKARLLEIRSDLDVKALDWEIPMPDQSRFNLPVRNFVPDCDEEEGEQVYSEWITKKLTKLVMDNHVVWLLTDNRESRWLPSLIVQQQSYQMAKQDQQNVTWLNSPRAGVTVNAAVASGGGSPPAAATVSKAEPDAEPVPVKGKSPHTKRSAGEPTPAPQVDIVRKRNPFRPALCYTVALGFDTFVAMRHGTYVDSSVCEQYKDRKSPYDVFGARLSCYFCNDLAAPVRGGRRSLDQQCTVTRNGVAGWAGALAVEAVAAMTQAHYGWGSAPSDRIKEAKAKLEQSSVQQTAAEGEVKHVRKWLTDNLRHKSCLGDIPHVIRGSLSNFSLTHNWHPAFANCVCCSAGVQEAFAEYGAKFVSSVIRDASRLEEVSGISEFRCRTIVKDDVVLSFTNIVESDEEQ